MIEVDGLTKDFGHFRALHQLAFSISRDHGITALLGPNGAGKTTAMRLLTGYLEASAGSIRFDGEDVSDPAVRLKTNRRIGYLPESTALYPEMLVSEYLEFMGRVRGLSGPHLDARAREMIDRLELGSHLYSPIAILSKGFRQRIALAGTLIHEPDYVILDEPTSGLDPNQIAHIRSIIRELGQKSLLILSTHILQEVEDICDRVIIISRGRVVADDATETLRSAGSCVVVARGAGVAEMLSGNALVRRVQVGTASEHPQGFESYTCELTEDRPEDLFRFVAQAGLEVREFRPATRALEDIFRELTGEEGAAN